ncbi:MAG: hypothetical protein AB2800_12885 [Candidatus Thiodiazotropha endolucinida]
MTKLNHNRIDLLKKDEIKREKNRLDKLYDEKLKAQTKSNQEHNTSFNVLEEVGLKYLGQKPSSKLESQEWFECYYVIYAYGELRNFPADIDDSYNRFLYCVRICLIGSIIREHEGTSIIFQNFVRKLRQAASRRNRYSIDLLEYFDTQFNVLVDRINNKEELIEQSIKNSFS